MDSKSISTAVVSSIATALLIYTGYTIHQRRKLRKLKQDLDSEFHLIRKSSDRAEPEAEQTLDEGLVREMLSRNYAFLGEEVSRCPLNYAALIATTGPKQGARFICDCRRAGRRR
jgi:hypothetical protein